MKYIHLILSKWDIDTISGHVKSISYQVRRTLTSRSPSIRQLARQCYWLIDEKFPSVAKALLCEIEPVVLDNLMKEKHKMEGGSPQEDSSSTPVQDCVFNTDKENIKTLNKISIRESKVVMNASRYTLGSIHDINRVIGEILCVVPSQNWEERIDNLKDLKTLVCQHASNNSHCALDNTSITKSIEYVLLKMTDSHYKVVVEALDVLKTLVKILPSVIQKRYVKKIMAMTLCKVVDNKEAIKLNACIVLNEMQLQFHADVLCSVRVHSFASL